MEPAQVSCLAYEVIYEGSFSFSNVLWIERTFEIRDWRFPSLWKGFLSFVKNVLYPRHSNRRRRVFNNWKIFSKIPPQIEAKLQRKRHHTMCLEWYSTCSAHWYQRNSGSRGARRQAVGWAHHGHRMVAKLWTGTLGTGYYAPYTMHYARLGTPRAQNGPWESKFSKVVDWHTVGKEYYALSTMHCPLCTMHYALCIRHSVQCKAGQWAHRGHSGMENPRKTGVGCCATPSAIFSHRRICKRWYPKGQRGEIALKWRGTLTRNQQWWSQGSPVSAQEAWRR